MLRIRREKGGRVSYATGVAPAGNITGLTEDIGQSVWVPSEVASKVRAFYAHVANAGLLTFESDEPPVVEVESVEPVTEEESAVIEPEPVKAVRHKPRRNHKGE